MGALLEPRNVFKRLEALLRSRPAILESHVGLYRNYDDELPKIMSCTLTKHKHYSITNFTSMKSYPCGLGPKSQACRLPNLPLLL